MSAGRWRVFGIATLISFLAMVLWSLASPLGTSPDEPSHMIRAASTVRGDAYGTPDPNDPSLSDVMVPHWVAATGAYACTAFKPDVTADCQPTTEWPSDLVMSAHSANTGSPVFYELVGLPSLVLTGEPGLYAMRFVSALLTATMVGVLFMALSGLTRSRWAMLGAAAGCTPMLLFLGGSVNPNGLEAAAAAAVFGLLVVLLREPSPGRLLLERGALLVVAVAFVTSARSIGLLWVVLALAAAALMADPALIRGLVRRPLVWVVAGLCAVVCLLAVAWTVSLPTVGGAVFTGAGTSPVEGLMTMLLRAFDLDGAIGLFGWVDTPSPTFTLLVYAVVVSALSLGALLVGRGRARLAAAMLGLGVILVPAVSQALVVSTLGYIWQGRYILALLVCFLVAAGIVLDDVAPVEPSAMTQRFIVVGLALLAAAQAYAFFMALRRYVAGEAFIRTMISDPAWQPPGGWLLLSLLFTVVMAAAAVLLARAVPGPRVPPPARSARFPLRGRARSAQTAR